MSYTPKYCASFLCEINRDPDISPRTFPFRKNPPSFLHSIGHSPFHHHDPPIYNIKRSTVYMYTKLTAVDRLGSGVWVSASFEIVALTAGGHVGGYCPGGRMSGEIRPRGECAGKMSYPTPN